MKHKWTVVLALIILSAVVSCSKKEDRLPYLGRKEVNGSDTIYHTIDTYKFVDQDSNFITPATFEGKIYVSDFFFTSCPTICPIMKTQMLRVYEQIENNPDVLLLSHSIDPEYDTVALLKDYAERLGVKSEKWHFVTGNKDEIYRIGQTSYMVTALEDSSEPGGFIHSGAFILVDKEKRVRGLYDGTKEDQVDILIKDIDRLLNEYGK